MISSQGTQVQRWSKSLSIALLIIILSLHAACVVLVVLYCPESLVADKFQGGHCETRSDPTVLNCDGCEFAGCVSKGEGEPVSLSSIMMSFKFPREPDLNVWNWKLTASLSVYFKVFGDDLIAGDAARKDNTTTTSSALVNLEAFEQTVTMSASVDYALNQNLAELDAGLTTASPWRSMSRVRKVNRTLQCRYISPPPETMTESGETETELPFLCVLTPLLELFPLSNSSYIASVKLEELVEPSTVNLVDTNATLVSHLSVVAETQLFHELRFYTKCIFTPLILFSLVWFLVRLCVNDLYINIPDRLIITTAVIHLIHNIPTELLVSHLPTLPYLLLLDPLGQILSFASLALFWIVFTLDKLADNEPWERTTLYYWRCIGLVVGGAGLATLTAVYLNAPFLGGNPFNNHWQPHHVTTYVSLALIFGLAVGVAVFQSYLSIIIFRVICDISIHYPTTSRAWRLKGVLVYNLSISLILSLSYVLSLVIQLCLHWNPEFHADPLPFGISAAGAVLLVELVAANVHVVFLLVALSRSSVPGEGWYAPVRPVMYNMDHRTEQLHLWDLSVQQSPLHKLG